jgi:transcriptional regulator with XRE-family HTH domain
MTKGSGINGLAAAMRAADIGPTELGKLVGTSKQNIERWAAGDRALKPSWAQKIAPHLGVSPEELIFSRPPSSGAQILVQHEDAEQFHGIEPDATARRLQLIEDGTGVDLSRFLKPVGDWESIIHGDELLDDMAANRIALATGLPQGYVLSGEPTRLTRLLLDAKRGRFAG